MFERLLQAARPRQRHLAVLVGLLVLTFGLTVVLAVRAHRAEAARQEQARAMLQDLVRTAAEEWRRSVYDVLPNALQGTAVELRYELITTGTASLAALAETVTPAALCLRCSEPVVAAGWWSLDMVQGHAEVLAAKPLSAGAAAKLAEQIRQGGHARMHDRFAVGLHAVEDEGAIRILAAFTTFRDDAPVGAYGYFLPPAALQQLASTTFADLSIVPSVARGRSNEAIFTPHVRAAGVPVLNGGSSSDLFLAEVKGAPYVTGIQLEVGLGEAAADELLATGGLASGVPVLAALMLAIGVLLVLALLLVRREVELVRLRADFISSVSHELRTPLAQIRMFTETLLLGRTRSELERRRSLEIVDQEARRLTWLVENVLLFAKGEGGRRPNLKPVPTAFADEIRMAAESFAPMCRASGTEIRAELQDDIIVPVDRGALRQIMVNLIENALKYGPAGQRVTVGSALFGNSARVWVDDEGPGIPLDQRERVFDSFYRMPRDLQTGITGSGIGLAVVRELAQLHAGNARVETAPGGGARLVIEFPDAYVRATSQEDLAAAS